MEGVGYTSSVNDETAVNRKSDTQIVAPAACRCRRGCCRASPRRRRRACSLHLGLPTAVAADQRVVAAVRFIVHDEGVTGERVVRTGAAVSASSPPRLLSYMAKASPKRVIAGPRGHSRGQDQRVIGAVLMVGKRSGLGVGDKLCHGSPPSVRLMAPPVMREAERQEPPENRPYARWREKRAGAAADSDWTLIDHGRRPEVGRDRRTS